jgi:hypothetical protein
MLGSVRCHGIGASDALVLCPVKGTTALFMVELINSPLDGLGRRRAPWGCVALVCA